MCSPSCLSKFGISNVPAVSVCPSAQDVAGLCGFVAATNIQSISGYSSWSCSTAGYVNSNPCSPLWPGITCVGNAVTGISLTGLSLSGISTSFQYLFIY